jgi:hypothetical protein
LQSPFDLASEKQDLKGREFLFKQQLATLMSTTVPKSNIYSRDAAPSGKKC